MTISELALTCVEEEPSDKDELVVDAPRAAEVADTDPVPISAITVTVTV